MLLIGDVVFTRTLACLLEIIHITAINREEVMVCFITGLTKMFGEQIQETIAVDFIIIVRLRLTVIFNRMPVEVERNLVGCDSVERVIVMVLFIALLVV